MTRWQTQSANSAHIDMVKKRLGNNIISDLVFPQTLSPYILYVHVTVYFPASVQISTAVSFSSKKLFVVQDSNSWILIVACRLLLPAGEGDDRVWWQAKAWLARVVPSPSRFLPSWAYGWRHCYPLAFYQQSITFGHKLSKTTLDWKLNPSISVLFEWHYCTDLLWASTDA